MALLLPNCPEFVELWFAANKHDRKRVPIDRWGILLFVDIPGWIISLRRPKTTNEHCLECGGEIDLSASRALYGREYCSQRCLLDAAEKRGWQLS